MERSLHKRVTLQSTERGALRKGTFTDDGNRRLQASRKSSTISQDIVEAQGEVLGEGLSIRLSPSDVK